MIAAKKPVFVTGASGMLGLHLVRQLVAQDVPVRALTRSSCPLLESLPVEIVRGDLSDRSRLADAMRGCPRVFHVAGLVSYRARDVERMYETNVVGTRNVLAAAASCGVERVVHTSSTAAIGLSNDPVVLNERESFDPQLRTIPYMWMKHLAEVEVAEAVASGLDVVIVNPSTLVGPGDVHVNSGTLFQQLDRGAIRFAPPGGNAMVSVDDAVKGHLLAMERGTSGRRYILSSENLRHAEIFSRISQILGRPDVTRVLPRWTETPLSMASSAGDRLAASSLTPAVVYFSFRYRWFSAERAREELGWEPAQTFEEAATDAVRWYRAQGLLGSRVRPWAAGVVHAHMS